MSEQTLSIPKLCNESSETSSEKLALKSGETTIIIGANGSGKTRLAVYLEEQLKEKAHRISAHRALNLNPDVEKISEEKAKKKLMLGNNWDGISIENREGYRWSNRLSTHLLNDFDSLLQYLFAQQANIAVSNNQKYNRGETITDSKTKLDILKEAWEELLPHRKIHLTADDIQVSITTNTDSPFYSASEMSDGERAVFYILGQVLSANEDSVLIFDEPELHIHKSIIANLWDKIEELRPDCAFLMITHDIEFAATRVAKKYVIRNYYPNSAWDIAKMPDSSFDEQTITLILGSRKPILFVEGTSSSLDVATYRSCYPKWTIIPKGTCKDVIQAVSSLRKLSEEMPLLNLKCAGIVDLDTRTEQENEMLNNLGIQTLPVSEIENLFSLTDVVREILKLEGYSDNELSEKIENFKSELINDIKAKLSGDNLDKFVTKCIQRKIDYYLKTIDLSTLKNSNKMKQELLNKVSYLTNEQIEQWISEMKAEIQSYIDSEDLNNLLKLYENKGLLSKSTSILKNTKKDAFENWIIRALNQKDNGFVNIIKSKLPVLD